MYIITCTRSGQYPRLNLEKKGSFTKKFNTLSEIAKFMCKSRGSICFPMLREELNKKELMILYKKYTCMRCKEEEVY